MHNSYSSSQDSTVSAAATAARVEQLRTANLADLMGMCRHRSAGMQGTAVSSSRDCAEHACAMCAPQSTAYALNFTCF